MTDKKKPKRIKIQFSAEALERLEQQKKDEIDSKKRQSKENKQHRIYWELQTSKAMTKLWQLVVERVKKDNVVSKSPTEFDKWVEHMLDTAEEDNEANEGWFTDEFGEISSRAIWKLNKKKDETESNKDKPNKVNQCAVEFLEKLAEWWSLQNYME